MTREQLATLLTTASAFYTGFQLTKERGDAWYAVIGEMEYGAAARAFKRHFAISKYPPTPAEIMDLVSLDANPIHVPGDKAWFFVLEAAARFGVHHGEKARAYLIGICPEIYECAKRIGWTRICHSDQITELPFVRRDFIQSYEKATGDREFRRKLGLPESEPRQPLSSVARDLLPDVKEVA